MMNLTYNFVSDLPRILAEEAKREKENQIGDMIFEEYRLHHRREYEESLINN